MAVYLVRGEHVAPAGRAAVGAPAVARAALRALFAGPTAAERRLGYGTAVPTGTALLGVSIRAGTATVDLTSRFRSGGGSTSMLLRVAQVVFTATQFPTVERVAFRLDGRPVDAIGGEGVVVSPPVGREQFERQAPAILVEHPLPGDPVGASCVVAGTANVFEARLVVDVRSADGALVARRRVRASAGTGTRGRFSVRLTLPKRHGRLVVVVYSLSPKDGGPINLVRVAVVPADP